MLKKYAVWFLTFAILLHVSVKSNAQVIVRIRPHHPRDVATIRTTRPTPRHAWVSEEWSPNGKTYNYHAGYWTIPPRPGARWTPGHWRYHRRGYIWTAGHW